MATPFSGQPDQKHVYGQRSPSLSENLIVQTELLSRGFVTSQMLGDTSTATSLSKAFERFKLGLSYFVERIQIKAPFRFWS